MLRAPTGARLKLLLGKPLSLGRQHLPPCPEALFVSRCLCTAELTSGPEEKLKVRVTSVASNPTVVCIANSKTLLTSGQTAELTEGDQISLVANRPDLSFEVQLDQAVLESNAKYLKVSPAVKEQVDHSSNTPTTQAPSAVPDLDTAAAKAQAPAAAPMPAPSAAEAPLNCPNPPVVLVLVGMPGSGKSTFSCRLKDASALTWQHVNQDAVNKGKPGTRPQCLAAAKAALDVGSCVLIDRCNFDPEQRSDFLTLSASRGLAAHCVVLALPAAVCAERVMSRDNHPGGVQGKKSVVVVWRMNAMMGKAAPASTAEGFISVMTCTSDADVDAAVKAWAAYGSCPAASPAELFAEYEKQRGPVTQSLVAAAKTSAPRRAKHAAAGAGTLAVAPGVRGTLDTFFSKARKAGSAAAAAASGSAGGGSSSGVSSHVTGPT